MNKKYFHFKRLITHTTQRGVSMVEILVAVFVLSLGLLGMASLQINTMKATQGSFFRTQAVTLGYYALESMRADRDSAILQTYNTGALDANNNIDFICSSAAITGTELSDNNRKHWIDSLKRDLGDNNNSPTCGAINCDIDGLCIVRIKWDDSKAGGPTDQTIELRSNI